MIIKVMYTAKLSLGLIQNGSFNLDQFFNIIRDFIKNVSGASNE